MARVTLPCTGNSLDLVAPLVGNRGHVARRRGAGHSRAQQPGLIDHGLIDHGLFDHGLFAPATQTSSRR